MNCPNCKATVPDTTAKFCSSCGTPLAAAAASPPQSRTNLSVNQTVSSAAAGADVTGLRVGGIQGDVHIQSGQVVLQTSEAVGLKLLDSISTEIQTHTAAGIAGSKVPERLVEANGKLDALLKFMQEREAGGQRLDGVSAAGTHISRVDLLLKKATLLKIQAEQMMLDQVDRKKTRINLASGQVDLNDLFKGFDSQAHDAKLTEAKALLNEARCLDPTNTEVLLHLAELLTQITEDDPSDERRVLYEVQSLLRNPKDDTERFRLAQATFLLATSHEPFDAGSLRDARDMFSKLGRSDWTRHCDELLAAAGGNQPQAPPAQHHGAPATPQQFNPMGSWNVQVMDALGSTMELHLAPDGSFSASQIVPMTGFSLQASGRWAFSPYNTFLQMQGLLNGFKPFMLGIAVQGWQGEAYYGVGTDGIAYLLKRA